jgi:hypothetical protein
MPSLVTPIPNHTSHAGAAALATRLKRYWADRGYDIKVWTEIVNTSGGIRFESISCVRSTLVNGLPAEALGLVGSIKP